MKKKYHISFIIPFYNESNYLIKMLKSIESQDLKDIIVEVLLIDGDSTDNSKEIALDFIAKSNNKNIYYKIFENNHRKTPYGFNIGINHSNANIIGFGGAHAIYPENLFLNVVDIFSKIDADVIGGGHKRFIPDKDGIINKSISALYISPLGAGVAPYSRKSDSGYVDTVWGGFYKRSIFNKIGIFNTSLSRGQDYELNVRVRKAGYKIYFTPILNNDYIIKTDIKVFYKRAFNTGFYLPQAWYKNVSNLKIRHIIPFCFFFYLLLLAFSFMMHYDNKLISAPFYLYSILIFCSSLWLTLIKNFGFSGILTIPIFFIYHLSYGFGTLLGLVSHPFKNK